jgi:hypothetical protein
MTIGKQIAVLAFAVFVAVASNTIALRLMPNHGEGGPRGLPSTIGYYQLPAGLETAGK